MKLIFLKLSIFDIIHTMPKYTVRRRKKTKVLKKSGFKKAISVLGILSFSLAILFGVFTFNKLNQQFASAQSSSSFDIQGESFYSVAYMIVDDFDEEPVTLSKLYFLIIDKESLRLINYEIPVLAQIDVPGKYSIEPFSNILALGSLNDTDMLLGGANLVNLSILKLFGFPVDRFVLVDHSYEQYLDNLVNGETAFSMLDIDLSKFKSSLKTNLTLKEFADLYKFSNSLPYDRIVKKTLTESYIENTSLIDDELLDVTFSGNISKENLSIAVLNGTTESGVANFGARVVRNMGGRVVAVGNAYNDHVKSLIIANDPSSNTVRLLAHALNIEDVLSIEDASDYIESEISRADMTIIVGLDLALSL